MQLSDIPRKLVRAFGSAADPSTIRTVPFAAPGSDDGSASYEKGFPPKTFTATGAGGVPPDGRDVNGVLFDTSGWARWVAAGGQTMFDSAFVTAVGGYPQLAVLASTTPGRLWQSTVNNNTTDPDSSGAAGWVSLTAPVTNNASFYKTAGGFVEQWGYVANSTTGEPVVSVTLPVTMADAFYNVSLTPSLDVASQVKDTWVQMIRTSKTTAGFNVQYQRPGGNTNPGLDGFEWRVVGKYA